MVQGLVYTGKDNTSVWYYTYQRWMKGNLAPLQIVVYGVYKSIRTNSLNPEALTLKRFLDFSSHRREGFIPLPSRYQVRFAEPALFRV